MAMSMVVVVEVGDGAVMSPESHAGLKSVPTPHSIV